VSDPTSALKPFRTLLKKEILRFLSVASQTLLAPVVSASLYLLIFGVSLGSRISVVPGFTYLQFVVPGLILMGVINNSFANVSSSLFMSRYLGNIVELLVTPLTPGHYIAAYTLAAMLRGLLVGAVIWLVSCFFTGLPWASPLQAIGVLALASFVFAQFGILAAIFSKNFDTLSMYTNFLILPLIYLGGLFYPVSQLPSPWREFSHFNPIYFLIEGFRTAVLGSGSVPFGLVAAVVGGLGLTLFAGAWFVFSTGYRLRS
jgi:ABC-2 type transport system permease protein